MAYQQTEDKVKTKQERTKAAIALAMQSRWPEAVAVNRSLIDDFPGDLESYNRMGRALTELGRIDEAREAFRRVLEVSPHNTIARKNLDRLDQLGDNLPRHQPTHRRATRAFIGESGKTLVTSLVNVAPPKTLARLAPGNDVNLELVGRRLNVTDEVSGEELGQVEAKTASRIKRLMSGGNRYAATVKSVDDRAVTIIIREIYKHPSQAGIVSFPSKASSGGYVSSPPLGDDAREDENAVEAKRINAAKDWSDDDTEPGDDEAFSPSIHRIINSTSEDY
jgi:hypothetical protein